MVENHIKSIKNDNDLETPRLSEHGFPTTVSWPYGNTIIIIIFVLNIFQLPSRRRRFPPRDPANTFYSRNSTHARHTPALR